MANTRTITSANAILLIAVDGLFPVAQRIQGFSADDVTDTEAVQIAETSMGVDGRLSAGWVPVPVNQNITLQADSESIDLFERWDALQQSVRETFVASGTLVIPATGRKYAMTRGFLSNWARTPALRKTLQPRRAQIIWQSITPSPN